MIEEVINNSIKHRQSVILKSNEPLSNNSLSDFCNLYPAFMVINPALLNHREFVLNDLSDHDEPVIVLFSGFLNRESINKVCEYAFKQTVIFLVDDNSPELDEAFSNKCTSLTI